MSKSKLSKSVSRFNRSNKALLKKADTVGKRFAAIIDLLESQIKKDILAVFAKIRGLDIQSASTQVNLMLHDLSFAVDKVLKNPLDQSSEVLWDIDDSSNIRKAIALAVLSGSKFGTIASRAFFDASKATQALYSTKVVSQDALAKRVKQMAAAFDLGVKDWVFSNIQSPIGIGRDYDRILGEVNDAFQDSKSPFRVAGIQPKTRAGMIGKGETVLIGLGTLTALSAVALREDSNQQLFAQSIAIHDSKTGQDSLDAETLTSGWVQFPEPYFSMTEFRRRPNDRCMDVIVPISDLVELGIEPDIIEES